MSFPFTLTEKACRQLEKILTERPSQEHLGLHLSVTKGGCAGLEYVMKISSAQPQDIHIEQNIKTQDQTHNPESSDESGTPSLEVGRTENTAYHVVRVFIDSNSATHFEGCILDYSASLSGGGFTILNPNAQRTCGCGTSFEAKTRE